MKSSNLLHHTVMSGHYIEIKFTPQKTNPKKKKTRCVCVHKCTQLPSAVNLLREHFTFKVDKSLESNCPTSDIVQLSNIRYCMY